MSDSFQDALNRVRSVSAPAASAAPVSTTPFPPLATPTPAVAPAPVVNGGGFDKAVKQQILDCVIGVECEAVIGGALMRVHFREGTNPADVHPMLRVLDPGAKVRDDFPKGGKFGDKETKSARAMVLSVQCSNNQKFISIIAKNGAELTIAVGKNKSATWLDDLKALNKVSPQRIADIEKVFNGSGQATCILDPAEQFGAEYFSTDDGKCYLKGMTPNAPAITEGGSK